MKQFLIVSVSDEACFFLRNLCLSPSENDCHMSGLSAVNDSPMSGLSDVIDSPMSGFSDVNDSPMSGFSDCHMSGLSAYDGHMSELSDIHIYAQESKLVF